MFYAMNVALCLIQTQPNVLVEDSMLLHIRPRLYSPFKHVALMKLGIEPFGVEFRADELRTGRPYPNRWYAVGCLRRGRKAVDGILIETPKVVDEFRCTARWAVDAELVVTHRVDYKVIDHDFDAASDSMVLWHATMGGWANRFPTEMKKRSAGQFRIDDGN
jgi:hypothetical protein